LQTNITIKDRLWDSFQKVEGSINKNRKGDPFIWGVVFILALLSMLLIYSATSSLAYKAKTANVFYLAKQFAFVFIGLSIIYILHRINYRIINKFWVLMLMYGSIGLLILTKFIGNAANSATRWVTIPGINLKFQSSDVAKLAIFIYVSYMLSRKQDVIKDFKKGFLTIMGPVAIACLIIAMDNFSTGALLFLIVTVLCYVGRVSLKYLSLPIIGGGVIVAFLLYFATNFYDKEKETMKPLPSYMNVGRVPTWISRVQAFLYPSKQGDRDLQSNYAKVAIAEGGFLGKLPGNSTQKNFLPDCFSDFIYAIIIEEYGLFGATFIMFLYLLLLYRGIRIFRRCPYAFGALLALGLSFGLAIQALMNMAVAVNIFPVTGFTLPFVSMGGTSFLLTCISIGLILSVSKHIESEQELQVEKVENI
jgi:cell division protein FtsW